MSLSRSPTATRTVSRRSPRWTSMRHLIANAAGVEVDAQLAAVLHPLAVERQHHVARLQPGALGGPARRDVGEDHAGLRRACSASAISGVTVCGKTPISPRRTRPVLRICVNTLRTMLLGAAKPMPSLPPDWL